MQIDWRDYQAVRDEIVSLILEGRPREAMDLEQKDGAAHFETCSRALQNLKEHLDVYAQHQLIHVQQTYYRSAVEIGLLVLMALLFVIVLFKLSELRHRNSELGEAELCERERNLVLQLMSENKPLSEVLAAVQALIERQYAGSICVIRIVSGDNLVIKSATRLPPAYTLSAAEVPLRPPACTCALAAAEQRLVFTPKIDNSTLWAGNVAALRGMGVRSCSSVPISSANHEVLGTVALLTPEQDSVTPEQATFLERSARLAAVGIEQRIATDQLAFQARHDALTGLPNRKRLTEVLNDRIACSRRTNWAVVWIDLDWFKPINDALGHQIGDMLLQAVAGRLRNCISRADTAARIGGDEFVLVLDSVDLDSATGIATRVVAALGEPFIVSGHKLVITASVGVGRFPEHGATADELLRNADMAMYQAKRSGKNSFCVFDPNLAEGVSGQLEMDNLLRSALDNDEMFVAFQPQVTFSGEIVGVEALLRWNNPTLGMVSPAQFIPLAEENRSIDSIGTWVLRSACTQAALWRKEGHPIRMAVNISALQLAKADFVDTVSRVIEETGMVPRLLELEITETSVMRDREHCVAQMQRLREMGVRIAIDDFGTGNSSLSYLASLPVDTLKIDRTFVKAIDEGGMPVIRAIMDLGRSMGLTTVAEGVEYEHQNRALRAEGCDLIQGFYFFKPMTAEAVLSHLRQPVTALAC